MKQQQHSYVSTTDNSILMVAWQTAA